MYPISNKRKNTLSVQRLCEIWIKMIHDDMDSCVKNLKNKHLRAKLKLKDTAKKRDSILNFCATKMIESSSTYTKD
jgi:hypothetical protein